MLARERIPSALIDEMRGAIADAHGGEVLFVADTNEAGQVTRVEVVARGSYHAVAAPPGHMARGRVVIHNHPSGALLPSDADVAVAAELASSGIGSYLVDSEVERLAVVCEPMVPEDRTPLPIDELAALIDADGRLSELQPGFEPRPAQIDLLQTIAQAFNDDTLATAEAGTGVGKSYAYLIPAVAWAGLNDERVVVSTATINLQQQLIQKDIPTVLDLLAGTVRAVLVKGRGNYLCNKRLAEALEEDALFSEADETLQLIAEWSRSTIDGSRSDLAAPAADASWSRVNAEADSCTGVRCAHYEGCFFFRARREAANARVLVVNHHLLFSDLAIRASGLGYEATAVLPPFQRLIIDEAHSVESSATSFFSESFSRAGVRKQIGRLLRERRGRTFGLLLRLEALLTAKERQGAREACSLVDEASEELERYALQLSETLGTRVLRVPHEVGEEHLAGLSDAVRELRVRTAVLVSRIAPILDRAEESEDPSLVDLRLVSRRLEGVAALCREFETAADQPERVYYLEIRRWSDGSFHASFVSSPLDVGEVLAEAVHQVFPSVVFTSATLTVNGRFDYWNRRVGLDRCDREILRRRLPSPFDYARNVLLAVPTDAPLPSSVTYQGFLDDLLLRLLSVSEGSALVLFTSYQMLNASYASVSEPLSAHGIVVLRQGEDDRARLLSRFNEDRSSVLFATESFWQGVDAPGETLRLLVICRLPFRVPNEPVIAARMEAIEAAGGNAFSELSLPDAVMRFTQGFGRLIRSSSDFGAAVVADARVATKPYGRVFLESLPETRRALVSSGMLVNTVEQFLYEPR